MITVRCRNCLISFDGIAERWCPACGTPVDPTDSPRVREKLSRQETWLIAKLVFTIISVLVAIISVLASTRNLPAAYFWITLGLIVIAIAIGIWQSVRSGKSGS